MPRSHTRSRIPSRPRRLVACLALALSVALAAAAPAGAADAASEAARILSATGVKGGLVVHVGCGDGQLTAALRAGDRYLVHGLARDAATAAGARERIGKLGLYGPVSIDSFDGQHLPYVDGVVNLLVSEDLGEVPPAEVRRVLAPRGVAYVRSEGQWTKTVQPWPDDIDEWTHYLHDASNNAVAHDTRIGPPRHLQWQAGPKWSRHHDHMSSITGMVSARGRVFSIVDEGSRWSPELPSDWKLVARDAFSGVLLWKRKIPQWHTRLWPLKSGPADLPRRLVAVGEEVYATLGITAPVTALDAATGKTLREYKDTAGAEEILLAGKVLLVLVNRTPVDLDADLADDPEQGRSRDRRTTYSPEMKRIWAGIRSRRWTHADRCLVALDAAGGQVLWKRPGCVIPLSLGADADNAYFHDGGRIVALDLETGKPRWTSQPVPVWQGMDGQGLQSWFAPTLVARDGKVLFAGGEKTNMSYMGWGSKDIGQDTMTALSAKTGEKLWTAPHPYSGYNSPEDLFVIDGKAWVGNTAKGGAGGRYLGYNLATGKVASDFPPTVNAHWFHHRCYRAKATDRFVLSSRTGIEFVDVKTGQWTINHWIRGGCLYGILPCNGMIYVPPSPCACYPEALIHGFTAVAAASPTRAVPKKVPTEGRLQQGPACGAIVNRQPASPAGRSTIVNPADWPTYRHDPARSGATPAAVGHALKPAWDVKLGRKLTPPIAAAGLVFVADKATHAVCALDAATGKPAWRFVAGGRVDSAPTYHAGRVLFGSASGYIYCLRASDGELAWRFRAAPVDRRLVAYEQVESAWPVHGSVLVQGGVVTAVAGRSMFLDGGLRLVRLDPATGRLLGETVLDDRDPATGESLQKDIRGLNMPVALPDILASDGAHLFMRSQVMDLAGKRAGVGPDRNAPDHLFAAYGFTDDSWFHRTYWLFGNAYSGGVGGFGNAKNKPAGLILANTDKAVFGYGRKQEYYRWSSVADYHLFAAARRSGPAGPSGAGGDTGPAQAVYFKNTASLDPTGKELTIAAWVKTDAKDGTILVRGAQAIGFGLILSGGKPRMLLRAKGKTHSALAAKAIGADWTHIAGVLSKDGRMEIYVNGQPAGAASGVPLPTGNPQIAMKVGYDDTNQLLPKPLTPFAGELDDVMLFHRALTAEQIRRLAAPGAALSAEDRAGQVLHLDFADGKARDRSPAGNHGRVEGAKVQKTDGPRGEVLVLTQPKHPTVPGPATARRTGPRRGGKAGGVKFLWSRDVPMKVRALAVTADILLIAGPPDVLDEVAAFETIRDPKTQKRLAAQLAAQQGKAGAMFHVVAADTGKTLAEYKLKSLPVFDGLIAAGGRVYITTEDGRVVCMEPKK